MKKNIKLGLRFKLDFIKDLWTFDYYFFSYNKELDHNSTTYSYVILFIGLVIRINNNSKHL